MYSEVVNVLHIGNQSKEKKPINIGIVSEDPKDYVRVALAIETLAYHNKGFLNNTLATSNARLSEEVQWLLNEAIRKL